MSKSADGRFRRSVIVLVSAGWAGWGGAGAAAGERSHPFPPIADCYWGDRIFDPDISEGRVAEYRRMSGFKGISARNGVLEVEVGDQPLDPRIREFGTVDHRWVDVIPRPERRWLVNVTLGYPEPPGPEQVRIHERQAARHRGPDAWSFFIPSGLLVSWKKPGPAPGEHPLRYSREPDTSSEALDRLRARSDVAAVEVVRAHFLTLHLVDLQREWDRAKEVSGIVKACVLQEAPGLPRGAPRVWVQPMPEGRVRLIVEHGDPDHGGARLTIIAGKVPVDAHSFWREAILWRRRIEKVDSSFVVDGSDKQDRRWVAHNYWYSAAGTTVDIHWPSLAPAPSAVIRAYLARLPSALDAGSAVDPRAWIVEDLGHMVAAVRAAVDVGSPPEALSSMIEDFPCAVPFLLSLFAPGKTPEALRQARADLEGWAGAVRPGDFVWDDERSRFRYRPGDLAAAPIVCPPAPEVVPERQPAVVRPLWEATFESCSTTGSMGRPFQLVGGKVLVVERLEGPSGKSRLRRLDAATGADDGSLLLPGGALGDWFLEETKTLHLNLSGGGGESWHGVVDPRSLAIVDEELGAQRPRPENPGLWQALESFLDVERGSLQVRLGDGCVLVQYPEGKLRRRLVDRLRGRTEEDDRPRWTAAFDARSPRIFWRLPNTIMSFERDGLAVIQWVEPGRTSWSAVETRTGKALWSLGSRWHWCLAIGAGRILLGGTTAEVTVLDARTGRYGSPLVLPEKPYFPGSDLFETSVRTFEEGFVVASGKGSDRKIVLRAFAWRTGKDGDER